jgi:hypothetical protein
MDKGGKERQKWQFWDNFFIICSRNVSHLQSHSYPQPIEEHCKHLPPMSRISLGTEAKTAWNSLCGESCGILI